jgi:hypothetical protein
LLFIFFDRQNDLNYKIIADINLKVKVLMLLQRQINL